MLTAAHIVAASLLLAQTGDDPASAPQTATVDHAVVSLIDSVLIPARQPGVLAKLELEDGTRVVEGLEVQPEQILGNQHDREAQARHRAAQLEHEVAMADEEKGRVEIERADRAVDVVKAEYEESVEVNARVPNTIPETQLRRQRFMIQRTVAESRLAHSDLRSAELSVDLRTAQIDLADITLDQHQIKSPIKGEIVQVFRHAGEWVSAGDPIMRVVRLDRLRVEGFLRLSKFARQRVAGQPVKVIIRLPDGSREFTGTISYVSPLIQASGDYRVWCEIENRKENGHWVMLPGMDAELEISLK